MASHSLISRKGVPSQTGHANFNSSLTRVLLRRALFLRCVVGFMQLKISVYLHAQAQTHAHTHTQQGAHTRSRKRPRERDT
eukprot:32235-Amphidinium_carterae.1